jgi:cAMP-dependent protein kinase regulator
MAQEHQEYIQNKVNPTLENLVTQVLLDRPDNPVPFMIQWLAQQTKAAPQLDSGEAERLRIEIASLEAEVGELEAKLGPNLAPAAAAPAAAAEPVAKARADDDDEEEEEDDDEGEDLPPPTEYLQKKQRTSVSAEAYGAWNQQKPFTAPVYEKTEDQKGRLTSVLKMCFLFQALSKADLDIIVDAMIEKSAQANERIIQEGADGDCMYVVEKGNIECLKVINEVEKVVKSIGPGGFFWRAGTPLQLPTRSFGGGSR